MTYEPVAPDGPGSVEEAYQRRLDDGWTEDPVQAAAVTALDELLLALRTPRRKPDGLYLYGPVGRGKSQLLDMFAAQAHDIGVWRTHMHTFMGEVHRRLHAIKAGDPIEQIARQVASECRVLAFDEFYVTNIADGMLLGRLFEHLFKNGIVIVSTSNWPMEDLFLNGHNRKSFLPFIRQLKQHMRAIDLGDGRDYRQADTPAWPLYRVEADPAAAERWLQEQFARYATDCDASPPRYVPAKAIGGRVGWFQFDVICERALGRKEYLDLVEHVDVVLVEGVPQFDAGASDAALRFVTLTDICYDHRRPLVITAAAYPDELYLGGPVREAFRRASSRLAEMQTWDRPALRSTLLHS